MPGKSYVCSKNGSPKSNLRVMVGLGVPIDPYVAPTQSWGAENNLGYTIRLGVPIESYVLEIAVDLRRDSTRSISRRRSAARGAGTG